MSADALLKSVLASPDDDLPRLVYADWLDEHGDPARAEFIRTQIELAKLPDHDPRYRALEDREHELLSEHEAGWLGEGVVGIREWDWKRGFLSGISASSARLVRANRLLDQHPITDIVCEGDLGSSAWSERDGEDDPFAAAQGDRPFWQNAHWPQYVHNFTLANLGPDFATLHEFCRSNPSQLHSLHLSNNDGDHPELTLSNLAAVLEEHELSRRLHTLDVGGLSNSLFNVLPWQEREFGRVLNWGGLMRFGCSGCGAVSESLNNLLFYSFAGTLKHLDISDNPIAPDGYRAFQQCHPAMRLDKLDVSGTPLAGISLEPLLNARSLENLTKLEINGCGSARRNMEVLSRSAFWNQATELRAHSGTIPASTLEPLCQSAGPPGLRLLDLADNYLRTEGVRLLCEAPWAGSLTWLALSRNYLDDESCDVLAKSGRFTNLRTLHLAHNNFTQDGADGEQITSRGVMALAESPSLANLRLLTLSYTGITDAAVDVVVNAPFWRLFGLGVGGCNLSPTTVRILANSPRLMRFLWLDLSDNPHLRGQALRPLAESPYLSRMCELDCGGIDIADDVRAILRERLGPRFSH
ncbi:MAG: TIGR02996 domain-containing protein [Fimbriiglobus sp.]|jgi:uncharacterized protein (TIGR02996 family)|nr:TIGR02996 domain-containing protein [Fimbriiglobus sp.]